MYKAVTVSNAPSTNKRTNKCRNCINLKRVLFVSFVRQCVKNTNTMTFAGMTTDRLNQKLHLIRHGRARAQATSLIHCTGRDQIPWYRVPLKCFAWFCDKQEPWNAFWDSHGCAAKKTKNTLQDLDPLWYLHQYPDPFEDTVHLRVPFHAITKFEETPKL